MTSWKKTKKQNSYLKSTVYPASLSVVLVSVVLVNLVPVLNNMSITRAAVRRQNMQAQFTNKQIRGDYYHDKEQGYQKEERCHY